MRLRPSLAAAWAVVIVGVLVGKGKTFTLSGRPGGTAMRSARIALFAVVVATLVLSPSRSWPADAEIAIKGATVEPEVFHAVTGHRVNFVKRTDLPVHVEFGWDPKHHQVYQVPATGPIWVIFNRPGTHPYTVHVYGVRTTTALHGIVEVAENPQHPWGVGTCPAVAMGDCLEP